MPLEAKPLFRPDVLRKHLQYFNLPAAIKDLRPELSKWAGLIESNRIDSLTEKEILPDILTVFFGKLVGYTGPADDRSTTTPRYNSRVMSQPSSTSTWCTVCPSGPVCRVTKGCPSRLPAALAASSPVLDSRSAAIAVLS